MLPKGPAVMQWIFCAVVMVGVAKAQMKTSADASDILLSTLDPKELDELLDTQLEELQMDVFRSYQEELKLHERTVEHLDHRKRRSTYDPVAVLPPHDEDFGHSYTYDTGVGNRQVVRIDGLDLVGYLGSLTVTAVFPLHLTNFTAIYKSQDGFGYMADGGTLKVLMVRNEWTGATSGCRCDGSSPTISRSHETCACCVHGGCLCSYAQGFNGDSCVACGTEATQCPDASSKELELDAAVGFEYTLPVSGLQQIVITAKSTIISFYKVDKYGLQIARSVTGLSTLTSVHSVTHLGYGETYVNHYGILSKKRFLVTFCAGQTVQQLHELMVGSSERVIAVGLSTVWQATGSAMKVSQSGGRLMITVLDDQRLQVYELKEDLWRKFKFLRLQRLSLLSPITTWSTFSTGFENYLILVSETLVKIYLQKGLYYHSFTTISIDGDLARFDNVLALNLASCRNELVLVAGSGSQASLYVWDWSVLPPKLRKVNTYTLEVDNLLWNLAFGYTSGDLLRLILPSPTVPVIYALRAHLEAVKDQVWQANLIVEDTIQDLKGEYARQTGIINAAELRLLQSVDTSPIINANITITQSLFISQTLITTLLVATDILLPGTDNAGGVSIEDYGNYLAQFNATRNRLNAILDRLTAIESELEDAIPDVGSGRPIEGSVTIINPGLNLQTLLSNNINIGHLLDVNGSPVLLEDLLRGLVRFNDGQKITGRKNFINGLVLGELHVDFLDDIPLSDLVTVGGEQNILGAIYAQLFFAQNIILQPGATIAGLDISKAVLLSSGANLGRVIFQNVAIEANLEVASNLVNGLDIERLFQSALLLSGGEVLGSLAFTRELLISNLDTTEIMGINVLEFLNNTVFKDKAAYLDGRLTLGGSVILQNLQVNGKINNRNFPDNYPIRNQNGPIVFRGNKHFSNVKFGKVRFGPRGTVDGVSPDNLVTKSTNQFITGKKVFRQGVHIGGNLEISARIIDGVNLDEIGSGNAQLPDRDPWVFDVVFTGPVRVQSLSYGGLLNGLDFSAFGLDIVYSDGPSRLSGLKRFRFGLSVTDAQILGSLNGEDINSLITTSRNHLISGTKTFIKGVSFKKLYAELVDGVDLDMLANSAIYLNKEGQSITGKKTFTNSVFIGTLELKGKLTNVDFSKVVTKSGNQIFTSAQTFSASTFTTLQVQSISLLDGFTVNGIDISDLAARRVSLKSRVDHTATLIIDGPVVVVGNLMAGTINGVDLQQLEQNLVTDNADSMISGPVTISNLVVSGSVNTNGRAGANGLSLQEIASKAVKLDGSNTFTGSPSFGELELRGNVNLDGLLNGVHLSTIRDDAVYKNVNSLQQIMGTKMFLNGFHVKGNIDTETTNGVDLSTRLLTLHTDQHISAYYAFENLVAKNNVFLLGLFNDLDLASLTSAVKITQSKYGSVNFGGNIKVGELIIDGSLDNIDLSARLADAIRLGSSGIAVTGIKSFTVNTQFRNLQVTILNSVNLHDFLANVVLRNSNKILTWPWTINGEVFAPWVTAENLVVEGTVDGVDYRKLKESVIYLSRQQNILTELIFESSIVVRGNIKAVFLNGRSLSEDYLTVGTEQTITVDAHLGSIFSTDVEVGGNVNYIYLPKLRDLTMQSIDGQIITGLMTFKGRTKVLGNVEVTGKTGTDVRLKIASEVIDLFNGGEIDGLLRFTQMLVTSTLSSSTFLINGINILDLYNNAWYTDVPATITARLVFTISVTFKVGIIVSGSVDGFDISGLYNTTSLILAQFGNTTDEIREEYGIMCKSIVSLYDQLEDSLYEGDCFEYVYTEVFPELQHSSITFSAFNLTFLILSYEKLCYSEVYLWNRFSRTFNYYKALTTTGYAHGWVHLETADGRVYVAASASASNNVCDDKNSTIWEVTESNIQLVKVLQSGESVSKELSAGRSLIHVHTTTRLITYEYVLHQSDWVETTGSNAFKFAVHVEKYGISISFRSNGGVGEIWIDGVPKLYIDECYVVHDASLVTLNHRVILFTVATVHNIHGDSYELSAYEVDYGNLIWLHTASIETLGKLTIFYVGNDACGSIYIAVTQHYRSPVIFNFFSERLTRWTRLNVPRTTWIQYFGVSNSRFPEILDHYLIFGRNDKSSLVYSLVMRGSTVPKIEYSCEIEAFTYPLLKPIVSAHHY